MKFLFIGPDYPGVGRAGSGSGIAIYLREIALGLTARGHCCHVLVWSAADSKAELSLGIRGFDEKEACHAEGITIFELAHSYWPLLERIAPDSRDAHSLRRAVGMLDSAHGYDWIEIQSEEGIGIGVQKDWPMSTILRVHTTLDHMAECKQVPPSARLRYRLARERRSLRLARHLVTHSQGHADDVARRFGIERPAVVYHGVDIETDVSPAVEPDERPARPRILMVGTADRRKGFDRIRGVLDRYGGAGGCTVVIVSRCSEEEKRTFRLQSPLPAGVEIEWLSGIDADRMAREYRRASALLHLARYESFGRPLIEAAAFGIPVVTTRVGIAPELLAGELERFLVTGDDPAEVVRALDAAIAERTAVGRVLRERYERTFTRDRMVVSYLQMLGEWADREG